MPVHFRSYDARRDFATVSQFLIRFYQPQNRDGNWLLPIWEYMHSHPALDETALSRIGLWEEDGKLAGVTHYESTLGEAFFQLAPGYVHLYPEMLAYAEQQLVRLNASGQPEMDVFVNDFDAPLQALVQARGYQRQPQNDRPLFCMDLPSPLSVPALPAGFTLKSLAEENDLHKIDRVLWRGFNHPGEPPASDLKDREKMQSGPNFRKELTIVVEAPDGNFVSFCGTWFEAHHRYAVVEPVATDPDYRRLGLGKAAVLEGLRRCSRLGAQTAYVGSSQLFYQALGFRPAYTAECWTRSF